MSCGCPVIIADGIKGTDDVTVECKGAEYTNGCHIGHAIMDADIIISLTHFKGHEAAGFGGAIKNIGMGCGSRAGKTDMHSNGIPSIREKDCRGCKLCLPECANNGLKFNEETNKMTINYDNCVGCGRCLGACNFDAIYFKDRNANSLLDAKMAEYTKAVLHGRPHFHMSLIMDVSPCCDCHQENDAPIIPDIGMYASTDPVAIDQACIDACLQAEPIMNSKLGDNLKDKKFKPTHDPFMDAVPGSEWENQLAHGEKIGLGKRKYELVTIK